ncbi:MAG TPA: hypothetical protein VNJ12_00855 [Candidatus Dormibacteraeota bacterium]|nr:hypothetical protein [Candidatus Dormibacteraeota bacterium]
MNANLQETIRETILALAQEVGAGIFTPAEMEQIRRQLLVRLGSEGRVSPEEIAAVLAEAGIPVRRSRQEGSAHYEEEFRDLLRFSTLEDAEMCLIRLDELLRKFREQGDPSGESRVIAVAQLGLRRAMMISRNAKVDAGKRVEKEEVSRWFRVWLENPGAFFDWLELRKQAPDFRQRFGHQTAVES